MSKCIGHAMYAKKNTTHWPYRLFYFLTVAFCGEKELRLLTVTTSQDRNRFHLNLLSMAVITVARTADMEGRNTLADEGLRCVSFRDNCS